MNTMAHRLYVLDTNVLMHDPTALFRFAEHDIFLPMAVMEELDAAKKGVSEVARNARQVSRFLDELIGDADHARIESGLALPAPGEAAWRPAASCSCRPTSRRWNCRRRSRAPSPTT